MKSIKQTLLLTALLSSVSTFATAEEIRNKQEAKVTIYALPNVVVHISIDGENIGREVGKWLTDNNLNNLKLGEYIDQAPFSKFTDMTTPYHNIGLDKIVPVRTVMEAFIEIEEDGFYYFYPLEEKTLHNGAHLSPTWSGIPSKNINDKNLQQTPWRTYKSVIQEQFPFEIKVNNITVFDYFGRKTVNGMGKVLDENFLKRSVTPLKLEKGVYPIIIGYDSLNNNWVTTPRSKNDYQYIYNFAGFNIHAKKITSQEDQFMVDVFENKDETLAKLTLTNGENTLAVVDNAEPLSINGDMTIGWVIDASIGLEDFYVVTPSDLPPLDSNKTHTVRFSFEPEKTGPYIFTHKMSLIDNNGMMLPEGTDLYKNCLIWGKYSDEWGEDFDIGLQKWQLEYRGVNKGIRERKDVNTWVYNDIRTLRGGEDTLLPIVIDENTVFTSINVELNYHCDMKQSIVKGRPISDVRSIIKEYSAESLNFKPTIKVKTPDSQSFKALK